MLRPLGYRSYHSGKWHVDGLPLQNGFDHSYCLNDHDRYFAPQLHTEDDRPLPPVDAGSGYYSTTAIANHAIKCLKEHAAKYPGQPFLEYLAFTAPHFPMQAPVRDIARYRKRYRPGWDTLRDERWQRMTHMNIGGAALSAVERDLGPPYAFPDDIKKPGPEELNRPVLWADLNAEQREFQASKMAIHAAMVDRMDREIGRILGQIRAMSALDNTLIFFLSDNGTLLDDEWGPNYLCSGYKRFFTHIDPYMKTMTQLLHEHRAPAEIMNILARSPAKSVGRNDPCPCGSGHKYKQCCQNR